MALPLKINYPEPTTIRRKVEVVKREAVELPGRFILTDRLEMPCMATSISNLEIELVTPRKGAIGERIVCYLEHVQRVEAEITEITDGGFVAKIMGATASREKTAARIRWVLNKDSLGENRQGIRIEPIHKTTEVKIGERLVKASVIDISRQGAAISSKERVAIGQAVTVGQRRAKVVRFMDGGFAVEFAMPLPAGSFDENVVL